MGDGHQFSDHMQNCLITELQNMTDTKEGRLTDGTVDRNQTLKRKV